MAENRFFVFCLISACIFFSSAQVSRWDPFIRLHIDNDEVWAHRACFALCRYRQDTIGGLCHQFVKDADHSKNDRFDCTCYTDASTTCGKYGNCSEFNRVSLHRDYLNAVYLEFAQHETGQTGTPSMDVSSEDRKELLFAPSIPGAEVPHLSASFLFPQGPPPIPKAPILDLLMKNEIQATTGGTEPQTIEAFSTVENENEQNLFVIETTQESTNAPFPLPPGSIVIPTSTPTTTEFITDSSTVSEIVTNSTHEEPTSTTFTTSSTATLDSTESDLKTDTSETTETFSEVTQHVSLTTEEADDYEISDNATSRRNSESTAESVIGEDERNTSIISEQRMVGNETILATNKTTAETNLKTDANETTVTSLERTENVSENTEKTDDSDSDNSIAKAATEPENVQEETTTSIVSEHQKPENETISSISETTSAQNQVLTSVTQIPILKPLENDTVEPQTEATESQSLNGTFPVSTAPENVTSHSSDSSPTSKTRDLFEVLQAISNTTLSDAHAQGLFSTLQSIFESTLTAKQAKFLFDRLQTIHQAPSGEDQTQGLFDTLSAISESNGVAQDKPQLNNEEFVNESLAQNATDVEATQNVTMDTDSAKSTMGIDVIMNELDVNNTMDFNDDDAVQMLADVKSHADNRSNKSGNSSEEADVDTNLFMMNETLTTDEVEITEKTETTRSSTETHNVDEEEDGFEESLKKFERLADVLERLFVQAAVKTEIAANSILALPQDDEAPFAAAADHTHEQVPFQDHTHALQAVADHTHAPAATPESPAASSKITHSPAFTPPSQGATSTTTPKTLVNPTHPPAFTPPAPAAQKPSYAITTLSGIIQPYPSLPPAPYPAPTTASYQQTQRLPPAYTPLPPPPTSNGYVQQPTNVYEAVMQPHLPTTTGRPAEPYQTDLSSEPDKHVYCCFWAANNECFANPLWMQVNCQKSCGTIGCPEEIAPSCIVSINVENCPFDLNSKDVYGAAPAYPQPSSTAAPVYPQPSPTAAPAYPQPSPTVAPAYPQPSPTAAPAYPQPSPTAAPAYPQPSPTVAPAYRQPSPTAAPAYPQPSPTAAPAYPKPSPSAAPAYPKPSPSAAPAYPEPSPTAAPVYPQPSPSVAAAYPQPSPTAAPAYPKPSPSAAPAYPQPSPTAAPVYPQPSPSVAAAYPQPSPTAAPAYPKPSPSAAPAYPQPSPTAAPVYPQPSPTAAPVYPQPSPSVAAAYPKPSPSAAPVYPKPSPSAAPAYPEPSPTAAPVYPLPSPTAAPMYPQPSPSVAPAYREPSPPAAPEYPLPSPTAAPAYPQPSPTAVPVYPEPSPTVASAYPEPSPTAAPVYPQPSPSVAPAYREPSPTVASAYPEPSPPAAPAYPEHSLTAAPAYPEPSPTAAPVYPQPSLKLPLPYPEPGSVAEPAYQQPGSSPTVAPISVPVYGATATPYETQRENSAPAYPIGSDTDSNGVSAISDPVDGEDQHKYCCYWAARDECHTNASWMRAYCQKSCGTVGCTGYELDSNCVVRVNVEDCPFDPASFRLISS